MREIKFRAYGPNCKIMWDWGAVKRIANTVGWEHFDAGERILMQYTGRKEKNGVEIYEGDICVNENGRIARCVYHEPSASFDFIAVNSIGDNYGYEPQMWKFKLAVIGNIYETPELLES